MRLLLFILLSPLFSISQNLIMNGGFEDENICTEYIKNCAPEGWISTSLWSDYYFDDPPNAHSGTHFTGLILPSAERPLSRNYLRSRLLCGLRKGAQYHLEFYIRSAHHVFDSIGVAFTSADVLYQNVKTRMANPHLLINENKQVSDSREWQKVSLTYTASGDENFIAIGDFKQQGYTWKNERPDLKKNFYFFLDDISLTPVNAGEHLCNEAEITREEEYNFNIRHTLLERLVYNYTKHPPAIIPGPKTIVQHIDTLIIPDVLFATGISTLTSKANALLDSLVFKLKGSSVDSIVVEGHTDIVGKHQMNQKLSMDRAMSVGNYLQQQFLNGKIIKRGWASDKPVADNKTSSGRQLNRRVEIYVYIRD